MDRNNEVRSTFAAIMSWVYVLGFFGGAVIWLGVNFMPWQIAVAAAAVVDILFAIALWRSERDYYRDNPTRARREGVFSNPPIGKPAEHQAGRHRTAPTELVRRLTDPLAVAASLPGVRGVRAVTSPHSNMLH